MDYIELEIRAMAVLWTIGLVIVLADLFYWRPIPL
jgi:hypothetical protein